MKTLFMSVLVAFSVSVSRGADSSAGVKPVGKPTHDASAIVKPTPVVVELKSESDQLFRAGEWQIDAIGTTRRLSLDKDDLGGGIAVNYFPWRSAGIGIEGLTRSTKDAFFDRLGACLIGRMPIDNLRLAPEFRVGFDHDMERQPEPGEMRGSQRKRGFDVYASAGSELRITKRIGLGAELRAVRPIDSAAGEHLLGLIRARLAF